MSKKLGVKKFTKYISSDSILTLNVFNTLYYIIPIVLSSFLFKEYDQQYNGMQYLHNIVFLPLILFFVVILDNILPSRNKIRLILFEKIITNNKINYFLVFICLVLSLNFARNYGMNFRHSSENLSNSGASVIFLFGIKSYLKIYLLYALILSSNFKLTSNIKIIVGLIGLVHIISINSSLEVITIFLSFLLTFNKTKFLYQKKNYRALFVNNLFKIILVFVLAVGVVFMGNANKIGVDKAYEKFTDKEQVTSIVFATSKRISTFYVSLLLIPHVSMNDSNFSKNVLEGIFGNLQYRLCYILRMKCGSKPEIWSVNRMNYLQIQKNNYNYKTGASPGYIASTFYLPFFPFNLFIMAFYLLKVLRCLTKILSFKSKPTNFVFNIFVLFLCLALFDSPVDLLNIISPGFIFLISFFSLPSSIKSTLQKHYA